MRSDPPPSPSVRGDDLPSASMPVREDRKILRASLCRGWCGVVNRIIALRVDSDARDGLGIDSIKPE